MRRNGRDRPLDGEGPEIDKVPSEEERSAYSDAYYRTAPREGRTPYGYNPARYYAQEEDDGCHRGQFSMRAVLALCLLCVVGASMLGVGGLYFLSRERQKDLAQAQTPADFYAEARQAEEDEGPLTMVPIPDEAPPMAGEDIYEMACDQVVGVAISGGTASRAAGAGIVLSEDGYIITNYHVIETGYERGLPILVVTHDGSEYTALVTGTEEESDLAVLKVEAPGLSAAVLADSDDIAVGERVYAVGNPLGDLPYTMTRGVISALDRRIATEENVTANMFQFDAAVNRGNSGGPVYNVYGQVVGVATAKYEAGGVEGLSFAIPMSDACFIANELITKGYVSGKAYLGLRLDPSFTPAVARYYRLTPGAYVRAVEADSAAQAAGLRSGDIITAVDGSAVADADALIAAVRGYKAGDAARLTVFRGGEYLDVSVTFGEAAPDAPSNDS